jgi:hypothetical protein
MNEEFEHEDARTANHSANLRPSLQRDPNRTEVALELPMACVTCSGTGTVLPLDVKIEASSAGATIAAPAVKRLHTALALLSV